MNNILGTTQVCQVGLVVYDIEKSLDAYCEVFGVTPRPAVRITDDYEVSKAVYRGEPTRARAKLAFIDMGQVQIELIEPVGESSTWKEALEGKGAGVHHIAFIVNDTDQVVQGLAEKDMPMVQQGHYTGGMYTYVDAIDKLGLTLELLENFK
jgi:catechol 2,3-dioxygenase-like lactoylglutathione lyase family enzyme